MIYPNPVRCKQIYSECNAKYFGGALPSGMVIIVAKSDRGNLGYYYSYRDKKVGMIQIALRERSCDEAIVATMLHEMIHAYIHMQGIKDTSDHGVRFAKMATEITNRSGILVDGTGNHGRV